MIKARYILSPLCISHLCTPTQKNWTKLNVHKDVSLIINEISTHLTIFLKSSGFEHTESMVYGTTKYRFKTWYPSALRLLLQKSAKAIRRVSWFSVYFKLLISFTVWHLQRLDNMVWKIYVYIRITYYIFMIPSFSLEIFELCCCFFAYILSFSQKLWILSS